MVIFIPFASPSTQGSMNSSMNKFIIFFLCQIVFSKVTLSSPSSSSSSSLISPNYAIKEVLTSGVTKLIWRRIISGPINPLSPKCSKSLDETVDAIKAGSTWAFECEFFLFAN